MDDGDAYCDQNLECDDSPCDECKSSLDLRGYDHKKCLKVAKMLMVLVLILGCFSTLLSLYAYSVEMLQEMSLGIAWNYCKSILVSYLDPWGFWSKAFSSELRQVAPESPGSGPDCFEDSSPEMSTPDDSWMKKAPIPNEMPTPSDANLHSEALPPARGGPFGSLAVHFIKDLMYQSVHNMHGSTLLPLGPTGMLLTFGMMMAGRRGRQSSLAV